MKTAVFPGSFDPFTLGHLDVLKSALNIFDKVIVAVGHNQSKKGFLPVETRLEIIRESVKDLPNVEVRSYDGMTAEFAKDLHAGCIIRGLRTTTDFELESVIAQVNTKMVPEVQTVFIPSNPEFSYISSTVVRDVLMHGGDVKEFMAVDLKKFMN